MKMDVFDAIALTIHANGNDMDYRTTVQKMIYFHTVKIENLDISDYVHHFYGPFNSEVAAALEDMSAFSYISQGVISRYYETYNYKLTESGIEYAETAKQEYPEEFEMIDKTLLTCKAHCGLKAEPLSYATKAHHILSNSEDESDTYSAEDVKRIAQYFGWKISSDDAQAGLELLQKLDLVSPA